MIYFGYTYCPDVCPTELARMAQVYQGLGSDKTRVSGLFVTMLILSVIRLQPSPSTRGYLNPPLRAYPETA